MICDITSSSELFVFGYITVASIMWKLEALDAYLLIKLHAELVILYHLWQRNFNLSSVTISEHYNQ